MSNRLGAEGLAALNIAIAVFGLINGLGMMLGIGGATRYTICRSRKQYQEADQTFTLAFFRSWYRAAFSSCRNIRRFPDRGISWGGFGALAFMRRLFENSSVLCALFYIESFVYGFYPQ